ncbi:hypothetical protein V496_02420 [Pseudogymnoascus sp. VKM F-4515 (FW-2607)]|nr:hypothetical protein V496_02420 [Pseudogymnoascus sp. VKM F-4515 (FW-2607)]
MPTASLSGQFDPNLRPTSPRHTEGPHNPLYQPFEALYYPHTPAPPLWSSTEAYRPTYGAALHLPPQQSHYQTKHHQQPSQDYNFALEAYVALSSTAQLE